MPTIALHELLNTLYITAPHAYAHIDHETIRVEVDGQTRLQVPVHHLGEVVCFGNVMVSPGLIHQCAEEGRSLVFLDLSGRFKARLQGPTSGNVLLRQAQFKALNRSKATSEIARSIVAGKIQNCRTVLMRGARQAKDEVTADVLHQAAQAVADALRGLVRATRLDEVRGREGEVGQAYFRAFNYLVLVHDDEFRFGGRNRRPPRDRMNALLAFIYALLQIDCVAAAEGVGLDPQVGFLHAIRPGRPSLALDLMEGLRPAVADRLALTLVNRRQITPGHFEEKPGGAVLLNDEGRRAVLVAYQRRKQEQVHHAVIERNLPVGLIPHVQARLLARHLRGDLEYYLPYVSQ